MLKEILIDIGLSDVEAVICSYLIEVGQQPASLIAQRSDLNRTTTYQVIKALCQKGIIHSTQKNGMTYFRAINPENLLEYIEIEKSRHLRKFENSSKSLKELLPKFTKPTYSSSKQKVTFYEGKQGLRQVYIDTLKSSEPLLTYSNFKEMHDYLPNFFPDYYKKRAELKIKAYCICPDNEESRERQAHNKEEYRETVLLPISHFEFSPEQFTYENKVITMSWKEQIATVIESKEIAELHKQMYQLAWDHAKLITNSLSDFSRLEKHISKKKKHHK